MNLRTPDPCTLNVLQVVHRGEQYWLIFDEDHRTEAMRQLGLWAMDERLGFGWMQAAEAAKQMKVG